MPRCWAGLEGVAGRAGAAWPCVLPASPSSCSPSMVSSLDSTLFTACERKDPHRDDDEAVGDLPGAAMTAAVSLQTMPPGPGRPTSREAEERKASNGACRDSDRALDLFQPARAERERAVGDVLEGWTPLRASRVEPLVVSTCIIIATLNGLFRTVLGHH